MTHFISNSQRILCLSLFLLCSIFIVNPVPAEEIIYASLNPQNRKIEIRISDVNGNNARKLFSPPVLVQEISILKGDRYILCVGEGVGNETGFDAYLFDTEQLNYGMKDLTYGRFSFILDAAISSNGDIVFANSIYFEYSDGIYFIPNDEIHEPIPKAEKLFDGPAGYVDWSPNGKDVVFSNKEGIFLLDTFTKEVTQILDYGLRPAFSPDGTKLAFYVYTPKENNQKWVWEVGVISLQDPQNVKVFEKTKTDLFLKYLTWTPDGKSIAYALVNDKLDKQRGVWEYLNFAVSVEDGKIRPIFEDIEGGIRVWEWTKESFPLIPVAKLTTTWGKLKRDTGNGGQNE
ncbi:MAG: hypothetical protein OXI67_10535 [Candidatus Poribacteria bacterium]|nr:hypothetical protein [Candidatus Poribacteria bacterium]